MENITIGEFEEAMLKKFPRALAESWDRTGLLIGNTREEIQGIAVGLDATLLAIKQAKAHGANLLLTHHPLYLEPPASFKPEISGAPDIGAAVYEAISCGVAVMNFHTALDFSPEGACALPNMLGLQVNELLLKKREGQELSLVQEKTSMAQRLEKDRFCAFGYGSVCEFPQAMSAGELAKLCEERLGRKPRLWGSQTRALTNCVSAGGSGAEVCEPALRSGIGCVIVGEIKYHHALAFVQAGLTIIELGHDVSELPLVKVLKESVEDVFSCAIDAACVPIIELEQNDYWA
jgi:dinuclear metal center YbgI/SA1388 family protein